MTFTPEPSSLSEFSTRPLFDDSPPWVCHLSTLCFEPPDSSEKKDAKRLAKVIKAEGKSESKAVTGSIKELERIVKLQKEAASAERKSQLRLTKWTAKEHKARLRFLKEKERYEKIEGELRNAENDYEERRDHAGGLTAQVAEKTQELDDLRGQKAADDVSLIEYQHVLASTDKCSESEKSSCWLSRTRPTASWRVEEYQGDGGNVEYVSSIYPIQEVYNCLLFYLHLTAFGRFYIQE